MNKIEEKLMPFLTKLAQNRELVAIKDGLSLTMPFTIIGSAFLIIGNLPIEAWTNIIEPFSAYLNVVSDVTFGVLGAIATLGISYYMAKALDIDPISNVMIAFIAFLTATLNSEFGINLDSFGATGMFTGILISIGSSYIYKFFLKREITIKMPEGVPPSVGNSFASLIPAAFIIVLVWIIRCIFNIEINVVITAILSPLIVGLGTLPGLAVYTLVVCLLWSAGIHGDHVLDGIATPIFLAAFAENLAAFQAGLPAPNIIAGGYWILFMCIGGTGSTLGLVIAMLRSKSKVYKSLGKMALPSGIFGINEPVIFGFPIVMNPLMMVPFVLTPMILGTLTYILMYFNIIGRVVFTVPWTIPPIIGPYLATNGNIPAAIWSACTIVISYLIYLPFFKQAEKIQLELELDSE